VTPGQLEYIRESSYGLISKNVAVSANRLRFLIGERASAPVVYKVVVNDEWCREEPATLSIATASASAVALHLLIDNCLTPDRSELSAIFILPVEMRNDPEVIKPCWRGNRMCVRVYADDAPIVTFTGAICTLTALPLNDRFFNLRLHAYGIWEEQADAFAMQCRTDFFHKFMDKVAEGLRLPSETVSEVMKNV